VAEPGRQAINIGIGDSVKDPRHDRIADLLKIRLEEIRARDGDLGVRRQRPSARADSRNDGGSGDGRGAIGAVQNPLNTAGFQPSEGAAASVDHAIPRYGETFVASPDAAEVLTGRLNARVPGMLDVSCEAEVDQLRQRWLAAHRGKTPLEAVGGHPSHRHRDLIEVQELRQLRVATGEAFDVKQRLAHTLALVPGVRDATAARLRDEGFADLEALCVHPRFGVHARRLCRLIRQGDAAALMDPVGWRLGRSAPLALALSAFLEPSELLFLDIETMGLFGGSPIVVAGLAHASGGALQLRQLVASTPDAEAALVREVADAVEAHKALVTFNGRAFDWPYVCGRSAFWGRPVTTDPAHFDLLPFSRRAWRGSTTDCRLSTLAREVLGLSRTEDLPWALVPQFYAEYLDDPAGRAGLLAAIAVHNRHDVEETVRLYLALVERGQRG
jgi:uncharacterized protein YprB with RNaseH-like and TPR domain